MAVIRPLLIGFATTFKHLFRKPITVNYPDQKFPMFPKFRGKQVLMRDENGLEKCVACGLCSVACPADAIYLEAAENDGTVQAGRTLPGRGAWLHRGSPTCPREGVAPPRVTRGTGGDPPPRHRLTAGKPALRVVRTTWFVREWTAVCG